MKMYSEKEICKLIDERIEQWVEKRDKAVKELLELLGELIKRDELKAKLVNSILTTEMSLIERLEALEEGGSKIIRCNKCDGEVSRIANKCIHCGFLFKGYLGNTLVKCRKCKTDIPDKTAYCPNCGCTYPSIHIEKEK